VPDPAAGNRRRYRPGERPVLNLGRWRRKSLSMPQYVVTRGGLKKLKSGPAFIGGAEVRLKLKKCSNIQADEKSAAR
jgi:hypothetical protein